MTAPGQVALGRHRQAGPSLPMVLLTTLLVLVTLVAGTLVINHKADQTRLQQPLYNTGEIGKSVSARTFTVTVLGVTGGVRLQDGRVVRESTGIWVVVRVRIVAVQEPVLVGYSRLRDKQGRLFSTSDRPTQALAGGREFQPGIAVEASIVFEVARDVSELTLLLGREVGLVVAQTDAVVEVPLAVDRARVDSWAKEPTPVRLDAEKVVGG